MKAEFWGVGDGSFFDYSTVSKNRHIRYPMLPASLAGKLNNSQLIRIQPKQPGEIRLLSADIALMSSKRNKNDATSIFINQLMPTKSGRYSNNIIYCTFNSSAKRSYIRTLFHCSNTFFGNFILIRQIV